MKPRWFQKGVEMKQKVTAEQKMTFVQSVILSGAFDSKDEYAVAILQQLVNEAKKDIATKFVINHDTEARKIGKRVANKKEAIKLASGAISFDEDTIYGAFARELGVAL